jgi:signal transduction histidine kinase
MKKVEGLALVGEMAAGIAHEIRNPMASISGSIEVLKEGGAWNSTQNQLMAIVSREIDRLDQLISDFLLFARPKETKWKRFDLNQVIAESLELFKNSQRWNKRVRVTKQFNEISMIESDPDQIKQVLWNLFLNACDAMPSGGTLDITTKMISEGARSTRKTLPSSFVTPGRDLPLNLFPNFLPPFSPPKRVDPASGWPP